MPLQRCEHFCGPGQVLLVPHVLQRPRGLRRHHCSQVTELPFEAVGRAHHCCRIGLSDGLSQFLQELRRFLQKDLAQFPKKLYISPQSFDSLVPAPQYFVRSISRRSGWPLWDNGLCLFLRTLIE